MDLPAGGVQVVPADLFHCRDVPVAVERAALIVAARREGQDLAAKAHQVLGLAGKDDDALFVVAIVQGTDADGVPGGDKLPGLSIVKDAGELRVQHGEQGRAILPVEGQQDFAVAAALEGVALFFQGGPHGLKAVQLPVAHRIAAVQLKGLHPRRGQPHDGQPVEGQYAPAHIHNPAVIRPP